MKKISTLIIIGLLCFSMLSIFTPQMKASGLPPVGYWKFDEGSGSTALDSSGSGNNGIIHTATWTEGRVGKALYFNGIDSWVQVPNNPSLSGFSQITLEAWIKEDSVATNVKGIISKCTGMAHPTYEAEYFLGPDGQDLVFHTSNYNHIALGIVPGAINEANRWYHVAATWSGDSYTVYVDGVARESGTCTPQTTYSNTVDVQIGRHGTWSWVYFHGIIDEVKIYNYARTAEEIWDDYASQMGPRAWKDDISFGLENEHLLLHGGYNIYGGKVWFDYLMFKDTGTIWTSPWDDIFTLYSPAVYSADKATVQIAAFNYLNEAKLTYSADIPSSPWPHPPVHVELEIVIRQDSYIYWTAQVTNVGATEGVVPIGLTLYTFIAGDTANDYYYVPGHGQGQFIGTQQNINHDPSENWSAVWDEAKQEGCGIITTRGFSDLNIQISDWYALTAVPEMVHLGEGLQGITLAPGETSPTYDCYYYFYEGTGWQKTKDFYDSLNHSPSAPQNLVAESLFSGIKLTWQEPNDPGSSLIQEYKIYQGISPGSETFLASVDGTTLEYLDNSVSSDDLYYYYVKAVNSAGESSASNEVKCSRKESIKGIESVVKFNDFKTASIHPFTIQQNFWISEPLNLWWAQNIIIIWPLTNKMSGAFEIYDYSPCHLPPPFNKVVSWFFTVSRPSSPLKDMVTLRSVIDDNHLTMENDFTLFLWDHAFTAPYYIVTNETDPNIHTYGLRSPEIVIVGNPFKRSVSFEYPTDGYANTYVRIGSDPGTWLYGVNTVIRPPEHASTVETSTGLQWSSNGNFQYYPAWADQGLWFGPDYLQTTTSPPVVPPPPIPPKPRTTITTYIHSPANLSLYDSLGRHTGYNTATGQIDEQIPDVLHLFSEDAQIIIVFAPVGDYQLLVIGTGDGPYTLEMFWQNETVTSTLWNSSGAITKDDTLSYTISTVAPEPLVVMWEYIFEDVKRGTMLKISTDDKYFQFVAPDKDFKVKHDPNMKILKHVIIIRYEDSEMRLVATAVDGCIDFCSATAWDKQTGKRYLLINKPNWRHLRYLEFL